jgi:hypothetical protein
VKGRPSASRAARERGKEEHWTRRAREPRPQAWVKMGPRREEGENSIISKRKRESLEWGVPMGKPKKRSRMEGPWREWWRVTEAEPTLEAAKGRRSQRRSRRGRGSESEGKGEERGMPRTEPNHVALERSREDREGALEGKREDGGQGENPTREKLRTMGKKGLGRGDWEDLRWEEAARARIRMAMEWRASGSASEIPATEERGREPGSEEE